MLTPVSRFTLAPAFCFDASGVAAVEFALSVPVLLILMLGGFDVGNFALDTQRVELVANEVAQIVAQTPITTGAVETGDGIISDTQLSNAQQAAMFIFPQALAAASRQGVFWTNILKVDVTSIKFTATPAGCTTSCTYTPKVVWTTGARPCNTTFSAVADSSAPSPTTLPTDVYGPTSLIVVDVSYAFKPMYVGQWFASVSVNRSYYVTPRNVPIVETSGSTIAPTCPGVL